MTPEITDGPAENTDRELYREPDQGNGGFYSNSLFVTAQGAIGINVGGDVIVQSLAAWHQAALAAITSGESVGSSTMSRAERRKRGDYV